MGHLEGFSLFTNNTWDLAGGEQAAHGRCFSTGLHLPLFFLFSCLRCQHALVIVCQGRLCLGRMIVPTMELNMPLPLSLKGMSQSETNGVSALPKNQSQTRETRFPLRIHSEARGVLVLPKRQTDTREALCPPRTQTETGGVLALLKTQSETKETCSPLRTHLKAREVLVLPKRQSDIKEALYPPRTQTETREALALLKNRS